jgi:hypothetical protein
MLSHLRFHHNKVYELMKTSKEMANELTSILRDRLEASMKYYDLLMRLGSEYPDGMKCWCEMRIGNPNVKDHTDLCYDIRRALIDETRERGKTDAQIS